MRSTGCAITGKPLAATAGAMMFEKGGNAVDAACAMLAATRPCGTRSGAGRARRRRYLQPKTERSSASTRLASRRRATPEFYRSKGLAYPPEYGPLAAVTPGTPGGLLVMLAEYGRLSLADVLAPSIEMADGYPIEQQRPTRLKAEGRDSEVGPPRCVFLTHPGEGREATVAGRFSGRPTWRGRSGSWSRPSSRP